MVDTVDTLNVFIGTRKRVYRFTNTSDSTGESAVIKIDRSGLVGPNGSVPTYIVIEEIQWSIQGFTSVSLLWDDGTDDEIVTLAAGTGVASWVEFGGLKPPQVPGSAGEGDVLLTTAGAVAGATYTITMVVRLKD